jgi:LacI family transcriptional regulator
MKKVIVSLSSDSNAMRECIIGIFNYVNSGHPWEVHIVPDPLGQLDGGMTPRTIDNAIADGINGVITGLDVHTAGFSRLVSSGIPVVLNLTPHDWSPPKNAPISILHNDDISVGRIGARHLKSKGNFRTFAFVPLERKCFWSTFRNWGFWLELAKWGITPRIFRRGRESLGEWIASLPKPAAIMTASDCEALNIMETCRNNGIQVPDQVAVLGVGNDSFYCSASRPQLSSVHPNHVEMGRRAAAELDRLMRNLPPRRNILIPPIGLVERESTKTIPPAGHLIKEALSYINSHYKDGITVKSVARHLGISEALLRLRFRTIHGKSVRNIILDTRLKAAQSMLKDTKKSIMQVADECGFASPCRLSHFFAQRTGLSPRKWRASNYDISASLPSRRR